MNLGKDLIIQTQPLLGSLAGRPGERMHADNSLWKMTSLVSEGSTQCLSGSAYDWVDNFGDSFGLFLIQKK